MTAQRGRISRILGVVVGALLLTGGQSSAEQPYPEGPVPSPKHDGSVMSPMRRMRNEDRVKAALRALERRKAGVAKAPRQQVGNHATKAVSGKVKAAPNASALAAPVGSADLYAVPNYATSKYPTAHCAGPGSDPAQTCQKDADCTGYEPPFLIGPDLYPTGATCTGPVVAGTGIRKFVDPLPGLCAPGAAGNCIPLAVPDTTTFPGSDYYVIGLKDYVGRFHTDLANGTKLRGYYQKNTTDPFASQNHYLGPIILAQSNRPVRVKFVNELGNGAAGDLFIPVDTTLAGTDVDARQHPYSQNRATIHLHGGNSPWISDGTQHQWTVPANEPAPTQKLGLSVEYVPDMWFDAAGNVITNCAGQLTCSVPGATNNPGDGALTFYYTNQQSGRLMFYHDHAYGITRLNVYAGEAAGYLLVNPPDEDVLAAAKVPGTIGTTPDLAHMLPLVIQDRTFVPPPAQLAAQDPTWDTVGWGGEDALWFPHVYTPNQWPDNPDLSNTNPMGRWDYGPWFWPVQSSLTAVDPLGTPVARPLTSPCTSVLAESATNPNGDTVCPSTPNPSTTPEAFMDTPVVNGTAYPTLNVEAAAYRFQVLNASNDRNLNLSIFQADASGTEVTMVPAVPHLGTSVPPLCAATAPLSAVTGTPNGPDLTTPACWPRQWAVDSRQGGVPDPTTAGPKMIQIGTEGGLLPTPAIIPPRPVVYEQNKRNIVVLNVADHALFMGPAERADVVVDFSAYAGKTLILYNDAPAPVPAGDPRQDPYTGNPDFTTVGGAPTTLPGYGPNIRTVMKIVVGARNPAQPPVDEAAMTLALNQTFAASQPKPIVPEAVYNPVYNPPTPFTNTYLPIQALSLTFTPVGEAAPQSVTFGNKALHELFTADYGRMNSLLGVEIPNTNWLNQTTIPFANQDPSTDYLPDDRIQIWKITHNGVDTHSVHFHLFNAQVINRVGWDGQVRAPDANELGWKDTVRMNPLEDVLIALRPVKQTLPFPLPDMWRPLDVDRPLGTSSQFTGVDVFNNPIQVTNTVENFGQEYVWHCHLLGHEEMDMLRAEVLVVAPETPTNLVATTNAGAARLTWTDNSISALTFAIERATDSAFTQNVVPIPAPTGLIPAPGPQPGTVTFTDATIQANTAYYYRVRARKSLTSPALTGTLEGSTANPYVASSAWSNVAALAMPAIGVLDVSPAALSFGSQALNTTSAAQVVTVSNTGGSPLSITGITVGGANANQFARVNGCGATLAAGASCTVSVTFRPTTMGPKAASLAVNVAAPGISKQVALTGTGRALNVSTTAIAFGNQRVGTSGPLFDVTLTNTGPTVLTLAIGTLVGANPDDFVFTTSCMTVLPAGTSCGYSILFRPTAAGIRTATLAIANGDPSAPQSVSLTGTGTAPVAQVSPAALTFSSPVNVTTAAQTVTVTNIGSAPMTISSVQLAGANANQFARVNGCGTTLAVGASCTVTVTFRPTSANPLTKTANLNVNVAAPAVSQTVTLTGTVVVPTFTVSPAALAFGNQLRNTTSAPQIVTVTNTGAAPLTITQINLGGGNATQFARVNSCPAVLAVGNSCTVSVTFRPTGAGARSSTLTVTVPAPAVSQPVPVSGTGL